MSNRTVAVDRNNRGRDEKFPESWSKDLARLDEDVMDRRCLRLAKRFAHISHRTTLAQYASLAANFVGHVD
jgi:hypothetical protein